MMKALNDLCIKISLCNRMSLASMLHHKDRSVPSSCQITSFASFLIFRYISLYFVIIFPYFSLFFTFVQLLRNLYIYIAHSSKFSFFFVRLRLRAHTYILFIHSLTFIAIWNGMGIGWSGGWDLSLFVLVPCKTRI